MLLTSSPRWGDDRVDFRDLESGVGCFFLAQSRPLLHTIVDVHEHMTVVKSNAVRVLMLKHDDDCCCNSSRYLRHRHRFETPRLLVGLPTVPFVFIATKLADTPALRHFSIHHDMPIIRPY